MPVTQIATTLSIDLAAASQYLRDLNARGLLAVTRRGANVYYTVHADRSVPQADVLIKVLAVTFRTEKTPMDLILRKVTAFTHPRRIGIVHELAKEPLRFVALRGRLGISPTALKRHLRKLDSRGFLRRDAGRGTYALITSGSRLEMVLLNLARKAPSR